MNKVIVSNVIKELRRDQCIRIRNKSSTWITIPLKYDSDIMTYDLKEPTEEEHFALRINWLTPPMEIITPQSIRRSKAVLEEYQFQIQRQD